MCTIDPKSGKILEPCETSIAHELTRSMTPGELRAYRRVAVDLKNVTNILELVDNFSMLTVISIRLCKRIDMMKKKYEIVE